jgi:DNA polymerase III alpha subunit
MYTNSSKQVVLDENDAVEALLSGSDILDVVVEDMSWISKFNSYCNMFEIDKIITAKPPAKQDSEYFINCINNWYMPDKYNNIEIDEYILSMCKKTEERIRVTDELKLYKERNLYKLLQFLIYFVDNMRENEVLWGVGRGSSVASYVLYLIGIHRVDSLKYDLDIGEFLK